MPARAFANCRRIAAFMVFIFVFCTAGVISAEDLAGRLYVDHHGYEDHVFVKSYVYIFEIASYIEVDSEGGFEVYDLRPGRITLKTYVPGFEPTYRTFEVPEDSDVEVPVSLQSVYLDIVTVDYGIPAYLYRLNETIRNTEDFTEPTPESSPLPSFQPPSSAPGGSPVEAPGGLMSGRRILDGIRRIFRRISGNDEENE